MQHTVRHGYWVLVMVLALIVMLALVMPQYLDAQTSTRTPTRSLTNGQKTTTAVQRTRTVLVGTQTAVARTRTALTGRTNTAIVARTRTAVARTQTVVAGTRTAVAGRTNTAIVARTRTAVAQRTNTHTRTRTRTQIPTQTPTVTATQIPRIIFASISVGAYHTCALTSLGVAYCWGNNGDGQLGSGTLTNGTTPELVTMPVGVTSFASISVGGYHTCALTSGGAAYCWGNGVYGQLGSGILADRSIPEPVSMPAGVTFASIHAGGIHTCALTSLGVAYCWGFNGYGQIGDGTNARRIAPVEVSMPAGVTTFASISVGGYHTCALTSLGVAYCWGNGAYGQLGDGSSTVSNTPVAVSMPGGVTFVSIQAGYNHTCALSSAEFAYCWGYNLLGQLGTGDTTEKTTPSITMPPLSLNASVSSGGNHTCARTGSGLAYCWGNNGHGQLGNGSTTFSTIAVSVSMPGGVPSFASIHGGYSHTCALTSEGVAYCWGNGEYGQLGNGNTTNSTIPEAVIMPESP